MGSVGFRRAMFIFLLYIYILTIMVILLLIYELLVVCFGDSRICNLSPSKTGLSRMRSSCPD